MTTETITGNTYPVRAELRALGGRWDAKAQGWIFPAELAARARDIVASAGPSRPRSTRRYGSTYTRYAGGGESYQNRNGRCEDAPCCGCCS